MASKLEVLKYFSSTLFFFFNFKYFSISMIFIIQTM